MPKEVKCPEIINGMPMVNQSFKMKDSLHARLKMRSKIDAIPIKNIILIAIEAFLDYREEDDERFLKLQEIENEEYYKQLYLSDKLTGKKLAELLEIDNTVAISLIKKWLKESEEVEEVEEVEDIEKL